jgi:hypothetical protein
VEAGEGERGFRSELKGQCVYGLEIQRVCIERVRMGRQVQRASRLMETSRDSMS